MILTGHEDLRVVKTIEGIKAAFEALICEKDYDFEDFEKCREFFKILINELRQMNYAAYESEQFWSYNETVKKMIA